MTWLRRKQTDQWGRSGWSYFSADGRWEISDEGPASWTLLRRIGDSYGIFCYHSEHETLAAAKISAERAL